MNPYGKKDHTFQPFKNDQILVETLLAKGDEPYRRVVINLKKA